jgi:hypothetical protein
MRRLVGLAVVLGLVGCSPAPPADTVQGRCQQQADDDPAVKAVLVQATTRSGEPPWQAELAQARHKAVQDCLIAAGVPVRGGVEPVNRAHYGLGLY